MPMGSMPEAGKFQETLKTHLNAVQQALQYYHEQALSQAAQAVQVVTELNELREENSRLRTGIHDTPGNNESLLRHTGNHDVDPVLDIKLPGETGRGGDGGIQSRRQFGVHLDVDTPPTLATRKVQIIANAEGLSDPPSRTPSRNSNASRLSKNDVNSTNSGPLFPQIKALEKDNSQDGKSGGVSRLRKSFHRAASMGNLAAVGASRKNMAVNGLFGSGGNDLDKADAMKERVRKAIKHGPTYDVVDFYKAEGCSQRVARSLWFENLALTVISLNAIWIAIDTDFNTSDTLVDADIGFQLVEHIFCIFFVGEVTIRFAAFRHKRHAIGDRWFVFDSVLVIIMVFETWIMTLVLVATNSRSNAGLGDVSILRMVRLLRLSRIARIAKLLRTCPELMILIKGMAVAMRSVFFTLVLLIFVLYVFGIAFTQLTRGTNVGDQHFDTVGTSMNTLLLHGTFGEDLPDLMDALSAQSWFFAALMLMFVLLASLTVLNMLNGVLVEVVSNVAGAEKASIAANTVKTRLEQSWSELDADHDNIISKVEFDDLLEKHEAVQALDAVGVDVVGLVDLSEFIFQGGRALGFEEFVDTVLQLRGSNQATVKDIVTLRKWILQEFTTFEQKLKDSLLGNMGQP